MENTITVQYSDNIPLLKYIVPFSYCHNGKNFEDACRNILDSKKWRIADRSDIVPSHEEDLYDHIYSSILKSENQNTNIGIAFFPCRREEREYRYLFYPETDKEKCCDFTVVDTALYIFKTGIGLFVYDAIFPKDCNLSLDELVVFQNRFKELNVLRGYMSDGPNKYRIYPVSLNIPGSSAKMPFYTLGEEIALKLKSIFGDVFYYPPRVNDIARMNMKNRLSEEWDNKRSELENKGILSNQKKYKKIKKTYDEKQEILNSANVSNIDALLLQYDLHDMVSVVPDKALLYSYVLMKAAETPGDEAKKEQLINLFCKNAYYLTRGYKSSYKVAENCKKEKSQMFERHENDYWDAALEGAGDYVLLYDNLELSYNHFFEYIRPREMHGDYFILYILLLYQHYSIILFSKKIAENVPGQASDLDSISYDDNIYKQLKELKIDISIFLTNSTFEAVGQITDVCDLYSFIELKLQIQKNLQTIYRGIENINSIFDKQIQDKEDDKEKKLNHLISMFGILAIISICCDAMSLITWFRENWGGSVINILNSAQTIPIGDVIFCSISILILFMLIFFGIHALRLFKRYKK